ncbi:hypothetical protein N7513_001956 [Penicillium frequentans]|nr:hypothetical protein N7513_001956 [Penicillium glabrum]
MSTGKIDTVRRRFFWLSTTAMIRLLPGSYIHFEDTLGHILLWWAKKGKTHTYGCCHPNCSIPQNDLIATTSPISMGGSIRYFDVCTRFFSVGSAYYRCSICTGWNFDICRECFEMGVRCLNDSPELAF